LAAPPLGHRTAIDAQNCGYLSRLRLRVRFPILPLRQHRSYRPDAAADPSRDAAARRG